MGAAVRCALPVPTPPRRAGNASCPKPGGLHFAGAGETSAACVPADELLAGCDCRSDAVIGRGDVADVNEAVCVGVSRRAGKSAAPGMI